ncbi:MAG: hypothetical protein HY744_29755 [Deltaproteobacteria bacterium]|nr:hypothetical protein [Deltaproteobacteria bacterium]
MRGQPSSLSVVSVGEATVDEYSELGEQRVGGISLNFAVHARRSGAQPVSLLTRVGTDRAAWILERLRQQGVDGSRIRSRPGATARQEILLGRGGERIFPPGGYDPGVLAGYRLGRAELAFVRRHDVLFCPLFAQIEPLFLQVMHELPFAGRRVADFLDLSDYGLDPGVIARHAEALAIGFVSGDRALVRELRPLSRRTQAPLVVTLGARGSVALLGGKALHQPAVPVAEVRDTTGCGDAFQAAFTVSYLRHGNLALALRRGARRAALVARQLGASG